MADPLPLSLSSPPLLDDEHWMRLALAQAQAAAQAGEVPVGAVVVRHGRLIATGRNAPIAGHDPTAHAEIVALRAAAQVLGNYRLDDCTLYVTLEPCAMCSGALLHARVAAVVYGASDPKTGAAGSALQVLQHPALNHHTAVRCGVLADECAALLRQFFTPKRRNPSPLRQDSLRTPEPCFDGLNLAFAHGKDATSSAAAVVSSVYRQDEATEGWRLHALECGADDDSPRLCCLPPLSGWSWSFRGLLPIAQATGWRVVIPDLLGFGRSDKPKKPQLHRLERHIELLSHMVTLGLSTSPASAAPLLLCWPLQAAWIPLVAGVCRRLAANHRIGLVCCWPPDAHTTEAVADWQTAPFPDAGHRVGLSACAAWAAEAPADALAHLLTQWPCLHLRLSPALWQELGGSGRLRSVMPLTHSHKSDTPPLQDWGEMLSMMRQFAAQLSH